MKTSLLAAVFSLVVTLAMAAEEKFPPIAGALTKNECGACHMAFQAGFLPAQSWSKIMNSLDDHFGEDATLDDASRKWIEAYLTANAGKGSGAPLRITMLRWFINEHSGRGFKRMMDGRRVKSLVDCVACHRDADRDYFKGN